MEKMPMPALPPAPTDGLAAANDEAPKAPAAKKPQAPKAPARKPPAPKAPAAAKVAQAPVVAEAKGPFAVVALREGYNRGVRIKPGDVFKIDSLELLGSWMKLV